MMALMGNTPLVINAYYNRDESLWFLINILRPLSSSWFERELITQLFYRRSLGRGNHFRIFLKLKSGKSDPTGLIRQELSNLIGKFPSSPVDPLQQASLFFMPFPNNSVRFAQYDLQLGLGEFSALAGCLEALAASGCMQMLRHASEDLFRPGVAITLADAIFEGFSIDIATRIAALSSFLQMFVPASCKAGKSREEAFDEVKLLLQNIRRDYGAREEEYVRWRGSEGRNLLADWVEELKALCREIRTALQSGIKPDAPLMAEQALQQLLVMLLLGLADCLLLEESDALATAYRLQRLYQSAHVQAFV